MTKPITRAMAVNALLYRFRTSAHEYPFPHVKCSICLEPIEAGQEIDFDHIHADVHGGPHEYQNLRPLHRKCHREKTGQDIAANAKVKRLRGERKPRPKRKWPKRGIVAAKKPWPKRQLHKEGKP